MEEQKPISSLGGRPTKYRKEFSNTAYQLALLGATDNQVAEAFDINVSTLYEWKIKYKGFSEALKRGKIQADGLVARALFRRATGFKYAEVTFELIDTKEVIEATSAGDLVKGNLYRKKVVTRYLPPDPGAAMSWLKNRQKELWRDKQEIETTNTNYNFEQILTPEKIRELEELKRKEF